jgi:hypothetical protein
MRGAGTFDRAERAVASLARCRQYAALEGPTSRGSKGLPANVTLAWFLPGSSDRTQVGSARSDRFSPPICGRVC